MKEFLLPDLGEGLTDAEIRDWQVKEGDEVNIDDTLVTVETAKAVVDIPSPFKGKIVKLSGKSGDLVKAGATLVVYEDNDDFSKVTHPSTDNATVVGSIEVGNRVVVESATGISNTDASNTKLNKILKVTPAVRALAHKLNVNIEDITASGKEGLITSDDVRQFAEHHSNIDSGIFLRGARRGMALNMARINQEVSQVSVFEDADVENWFGREKVTLRLIHAIVKAIQAEPKLNSLFDFNLMTLDLRKEINIGLAIDTDDGLYAPVLLNVANRSDDDLLEEIENLKAKARKKTFKQDQLRNATILLSNYGTIAGRYATPIVVPPAVAIVAVGRVRPEIKPIQGLAIVRRILPISLSFDHRALTGGDSSRFLAALVEDLER